MHVNSVRHGFLCNNSGLSILLHGVISLSDATSCDKILLHKKAVSHAINSQVLPSKNPCINQAIHVLLMHGFCNKISDISIKISYLPK